MISIAVVESTRTVVPVALPTAIPFTVAVGPSLVEPARSTVAAIAVAAVVRAAAAPGIGMEAGSAATGDELDDGLTAALFEGIERKGSRVDGRCQTESGKHHRSYPEGLHAYHDLNLIGVRSLLNRPARAKAAPRLLNHG